MFKRISVAEAAQLIKEQQALVVDVRDSFSYAQGHIAGATRIDNANIESYVSQADKNKPLIVCCYHGNSSQPAAAVFAEHGFVQSYSMDGGMTEWVLTQQVETGQ